MTTQTRDATKLGAHHVDCGGELLLYTDAGGDPVPSRKGGCLRAYCEGCGAVGPVSCDQALRMNTGMQLPAPRLTLDTYGTTKNGLVDQRTAPNREPRRPVVQS